MMACINAPTAQFEQYLVYELNKICPCDITQEFTPVKTHYNPKDPRNPDPEETKEEKAISQSISTKDIPDGAKALHKEHSFTHELMRHAETPEERFKHAHTIMSEIIPSLDALYNGKQLPIRSKRRM